MIVENTISTFGILRNAGSKWRNLRGKGLQSKNSATLAKLAKVDFFNLTEAVFLFIIEVSNLNALPTLNAH